MDSTRTCLACRQKEDRGSLLRFVRAPDGEICFDEKASLPHRGAWLCPKKACISKAFEKRMLFRGEKTLPVNVEEMKLGIALRVKASILNRLGLLRRMGHCKVGRDEVIRLAKAEGVEAVVIASDLASRSLNEIKSKLTGHRVALIQSPFTMDEFGNCLGRSKTGVVALLKSRITDEILLQVNRLSALGL